MTSVHSEQKQNLQTSFREQQFLEHQKRIISAHTAYENMLQMSDILTEGELITDNPTELNEFLKGKWNYPNVAAAAELHDLASEYKFYNAAHAESVEYFDYFSLVKGTAESSINQSKLDQLKESYTTRLTDEEQILYDELNNAVEALNEAINSNYKYLVNCIYEKPPFHEVKGYAVNVSAMRQILKNKPKN